MCVCVCVCVCLYIKVKYLNLPNAALYVNKSLLYTDSGHWVNTHYSKLIATITRMQTIRNFSDS